VLELKNFIDIRTVQELKNAIENSNVNASEEAAQKLLRFKGRLESFLKALDSSFDWNLLQDIPQYVLEFEGNYK
jgi:hypothetical protein